MVCILGLFSLVTVLATFQKILGDFFLNHLVTLDAGLRPASRRRLTRMRNRLRNRNLRLNGTDLPRLSRCRLGRLVVERGGRGLPPVEAAVSRRLKWQKVT
jgi:hypothetical protein